MPKGSRDSRESRPHSWTPEILIVLVTIALAFWLFGTLPSYEFNKECDGNGVCIITPVKK